LPTALSIRAAVVPASHDYHWSCRMSLTYDLDDEFETEGSLYLLDHHPD
jgi:hypothetical protein